MQTVVITGSARGLGYECAKVFRKNEYNVVLSDINEEGLKTATDKLRLEEGQGEVKYKLCDVTKLSEVEQLMQYSIKEFERVDIWINNAGVNQPEKHTWELDEQEIQRLIDIDLKGTINGSTVAMKQMLTQDSGAIYNVEGFGSNDAYQEYLTIYGTAKRAVTYFTKSLANEVKLTNSKILIGRLSPGIMFTSFLTSTANKENAIELSEKTKKVYNILGDYPDVVAQKLVSGMINNTKNDVKIEWLTSFKAFKRFMLAGFNKRDVFK